MGSSRRSSNPPEPEASEPFPALSPPADANSPRRPSAYSEVTHPHPRPHVFPPTVVLNDGNDPLSPVKTQQPEQSKTDLPPATQTRSEVLPHERHPPPLLSPIRRRPIGIRRLPSASSVASDDHGESSGQASGNRSRSTSAPLNYHSNDPLSRQSTRADPLPTLTEESSRHVKIPGGTDGTEAGAAYKTEQSSSGVGRRRSVSNAARSMINKLGNDGDHRPPDQEYQNDVVDFLDVIDPEVSTLTTLNNVQNSLFVPDLGSWINRRPTYNLARPQGRRGDTATSTKATLAERRRSQPRTPEPEDDQEPLSQTPSLQRGWSWQRQPPRERRGSITSVLSDSHYAVLPHGVTLEDWTEEDKEALDDHVRHMLHSKRSKFNQRMKAFGQYVRKPLGFFVTLYAVLITLFGLAWVLFLIGWIYVDRQSYIVNVIDNVLVALFALVGDGMAPFRAVDTYHMIYIAHYHHLTWRLRREQALPKLQDRNDLPEQSEKEVDPEAGKPEDSEFSVLSEAQQRKLIHHQAKFSKSHSFYKPHETSTHRAFPLRLLVAVVVLLDCHSLFQIALGTCTWAIDYKTRPQAITATILSCSITVNIMAGVLISIGDRRTRKKDVVLRMARQELTQEAIKKVQKHKADREANLNHAAAEENLEIIREREENTHSSGQAQSHSGP